MIGPVVVIHHGAYNYVHQKKGMVVVGSGIDMERQLVNRLADEGIYCMRSPSSGGGTERALPDVVARRNGETIAVELKYTRGDRIRITKAEIEELERFADGFDARPLIAVRFSHDTTFYLICIQDMKENESSYSIGRDVGGETTPAFTL